MLSACGHKEDRALTPAEALESFRLSEDFHTELFLAEPDVVDPVEVAFDEDGRVYVAEMIDYPDDPPAGKPARSRIRMLEDRNGDGKYETSIVYAEHVLQVSSLMPWKGGLLVTSAPDILYLKDENGDGKADTRKVLYTGFPKVNPEARITNLRLGIDNWIYAANNGSNGEVRSVEHPEWPPVLIRGADFRFDPVSGKFEAASGPTQYGMTFDDWGNRFMTQNTIHIRHSVMPMRYLARAPLLQADTLAEDISDHGSPSVPVFPLTKPQSWREQRTKLRQQRYDENKLNRVEQVGGFFTAASGGTAYTGDAFPAEYVGNVFTGDVNGNLIHRDILTPKGVTFSAHRGKDGVEFLASTDVWFRPCNFANAPDGNLYFTDIYREFIETPESIPEEIKKDMDFWSGSTMGRIYRIVPNHPRRKRDLRPSLSKATPAQLVEHLASTNGWHRMTAQRLLLERQDRSVAPQLREMAAKSSDPLARAHALWMLSGLGVLDPATVAAALKDPHAGVREQAVRLAEGFFPALGPAVAAMATDPEPRVEFQVALSLGDYKAGGRLHPSAVEALVAIARKNEGDRWFRLAVLSSTANEPATFLTRLMSRGSTQLTPELASLAGARKNAAEISMVLSSIAKLEAPADALAGLARGLNLVGVRGLSGPGLEAAMMRYLDSPSEPVQNAAWEVARHLDLRGVVARAQKDALNTSLPVERQARAVRALRSAPFATASPLLERVLAANPPSVIQEAAVDSLAGFDDPAVPGLLLKEWRGYQPKARARAIGAMLASQVRLKALLDALEQGQVEVGALDVAARARLLESGERARKLLQSSSTDRARVVAEYHSALTLKGDVQRGKVLFEDNCARCHMPRREGGRVGPDLSGINNKTKEELLQSILDPSYAIDSRFTNYIVTTKDGRMYDGVIANETPAVITLRGGSEDGDQNILRSNVESVRASSISLMPEELEKSISQQGVADLISYLRGGL